MIMDTSLITYMEGQLRATTSEFHRYMYDKLPWNSRMFGLVGPRGIGKSTLMLQYVKEHRQEENILYVAADNLYFSTHSLIEMADEFAMEAGQHLIIDEIHKYSNWSSELKQIYDTHPDLKVSFTGSSILDIYKGSADLSRRAPIFTMQGLSFREYLNMYHNIVVPVYSLNDIIALKVEIPELQHPLPLFNDFLQRGYYPFANDENFALEIRQVINQTMEVDIPQFANMNVSTGRKLKQLLSIISKSVPFKPVMNNLSNTLGVSRNNIADYLMYIEQAGMISQVRDATGGIRGLGKVEKVYLDNPVLIYALADNQPDIGNVRETFFYNQMRVMNDVIVSRISDFDIDGKTFEIGGPSKGQRQVKAASDGYVVKDNIEFGSGNIIPLWHFGMNY